VYDRLDASNHGLRMPPAKPTQPVLSYAIDDVAYASLRADSERANQAKKRCNVCNRRIDGAPAGSGLLLWTRGEELRFDEPPLCASCATAIGVTALAQWAMEDGEG